LQPWQAISLCEALTLSYQELPLLHLRIMVSFFIVKKIFFSIQQSPAQHATRLQVFKLVGSHLFRRINNRLLYQSFAAASASISLSLSLSHSLSHSLTLSLPLSLSLSPVSMLKKPWVQSCLSLLMG
jgi:hypothetical protein